MWWGFAIENFDTQRVFNFISILKGIFFPVTVFAIYNIESPFQPKNTTKAVVEANLTKVDKELEDQIKDIDKLDLTPETMRRNGALIFSVYFNVICAFEAGCAPVISETKGTTCTTNVDIYNVASRTGASDRSKRYTLDGSKWSSKNLTYQISKYPTGLNKTVVDGEIARAFALWSDRTDRTFSPISSGKVDIKIRFESGKHGDGHPFDGRGGKQLAHSNYPGPGCQVHFDDDEDWTIDSHEGINLFQVAVHELGHSLGLDHSHVKGSVMNPQYGVYNPNFMLSRDDIAGIQALYGSDSTVSRSV